MGHSELKPIEIYSTTPTNGVLTRKCPNVAGLLRVAPGII